MEKLHTQRKELEEELAYILYYPKDMKYVSLLVGELNQRNISIVTKAKAEALKKWREDVDSGRGDRVSNCLGGEVSSTVGDRGGDGKSLRKLLGTKKTSIFKSQDSIQAGSDSGDDIQPSGEEPMSSTEDDFFAENVGNQSSASRSTKRKFPGEAFEQRALPTKLAPGTKQGERLRKWQRLQSKKSSFISVARRRNDSFEKSRSSAPQVRSQKRYQDSGRVSNSNFKKPSLPTPHSNSRTRAAWEEGGGVSASVSTARNRQKQLGLIVEGKGKKKVFGEDD